MSLLQEPVDVLNTKTIKSVCYAENSDFDLKREAFKKCTNISTQPDESGGNSICQESYQEPQTKRETFDVLDTPPVINIPINYISDAYEEDSASETDDVIDAITPYPTPTGSPITHHSR